MNNQLPTSPQYLTMQPSYYPNPPHAFTDPSWPNLNVMPQNYMPGNNMMPNYQMTSQNHMPSNGMMKTPYYQQGTMMPYQPPNPTAQGAISSTMPFMYNYPNAPMMTNYQTIIPPPNSPNMLMPSKFGFNGVQLTNGLMPNGSVMPTTSSVNLMPNQQYGMMDSNNATKQFAAENDTACIEVWSDNQERMLSRVKELARTYKIIALDTEFPGDPLGSNDNWRNASTQEAYDFIKKNVDCSNMISLG